VDAEPSLSPTLAVVLPLVGVLVGALLAGVVRYLLDRRAEWADFRASVRVMIDDLSRIEALTSAQHLSLPREPRDIRWLKSDAWEAERSRMARGLLGHEDEWDLVRHAVVQADIFHGLLTQPSDEPLAFLNRMKTQDETRERSTAALVALRRIDVRARRRLAYVRRS
jgi:hypothetical protein